MSAILLLGFLIQILFAGLATGRTIYVDPNGSADFTSIQGAIDDANNFDEIEVAPGTYNEAINFIGKAITVRNTSGDPNDTIIDGTGNFHVVQFVSGEGTDTVLEGFTITGGDANGTVFPDNIGGGMYCEGSSPTVTNCSFADNSAIWGGGMHNRDNSNPTVTHCRFSGNSANYGGGMYNKASNPVVTDCTFIGNSAVISDGGGIFSYNGSNLTITNCTFSSNNADMGGGVANIDYSNLSMVNCTFSNNTATSRGGGVYDYGRSTVAVDCIFSANSATYRGGGLYISSNNPTITSCTFVGNMADDLGGGIYIGSGNPTITNCIFSGNAALNNGGGVYNYSSRPTMVNCTVCGNTAGNSGGGLYNYSNSGSPTAFNCIFWKNSDTGGVDQSAQIHLNYGSATVSYSDVSGGWSGSGGNNINADPLFLDPNGVDGVIGTRDDNLRLQYDSPCVDAADSSVSLSIPIFDLDKNDRTVDVGPVVDTGAGSLTYLDMGAYEFQCGNFHGDLNCDGVVDFKDVAILCDNWLAGTEPGL
jgi:hypothetical protein